MKVVYCCTSLFSLRTITASLFLSFFVGENFLNYLSIYLLLILKIYVSGKLAAHWCT